MSNKLSELREIVAQNGAQQSDLLNKKLNSAEQVRQYVRVRHADVFYFVPMLAGLQHNFRDIKPVFDVVGTNLKDELGFNFEKKAVDPSRAHDLSRDDYHRLIDVKIDFHRNQVFEQQLSDLSAYRWYLYGSLCCAENQISGEYGVLRKKTKKHFKTQLSRALGEPLYYLEDHENHDGQFHGPEAWSAAEKAWPHLSIQDKRDLARGVEDKNIARTKIIETF